MIRFQVTGSEDLYTGFICAGHAGYREAGQDIICSAVSALTVNTVNSLETLTEDAFAVEQSEDGGYLKLELSEIPSEAAQLLLRSLILGMQNIQEAYGEDYVSVTLPGAHSK